MTAGGPRCALLTVSTLWCCHIPHPFLVNLQKRTPERGGDRKKKPLTIKISTREKKNSSQKNSSSREKKTLAKNSLPARQNLTCGEKTITCEGENNNIQDGVAVAVRHRYACRTTRRVAKTTLEILCPALVVAPIGSSRWKGATPPPGVERTTRGNSFKKIRTTNLTFYNFERVMKNVLRNFYQFVSIFPVFLFKKFKFFANVNHLPPWYLFNP